MSRILIELYRHNRWANLRLVEVCRELSDTQLDATVQGTAGSVRETLRHIASAEGRYVERLGGPAPTHRVSKREGWPGFDALRGALEASGAALIELVQTIDPERVLDTVYQGQRRALPVTTVFVQAINHATEHRSQIATILTQQGIEPPELSGWRYGQESG